MMIHFLLSLLLHNLLTLEYRCYGQLQRSSQFQRYPAEGYFPGVLDTLQTRSRSHCAALCLEIPGCVSIAIHSPGMSDEVNSRTCQASDGDGSFVVDTEWNTYILSTCDEDSEASCRTWTTSAPTTLATTPTTTPRTCPTPDFELLDNYCYKYHTIPLPWEEAKIMCESESAHLVTVSSQIEQNMVSMRVLGLRGGGTVFYGGGRFSPASSSWSWINNDPFGFISWTSGPPNGPTEQCLLIATFPDNWSASNCDVPHEYMCEIDL